MGLTISQVYGDEGNREQKLKQVIGFGIHVALPAVVQSYNSSKQTVEVQPTVREKTISDERQIRYVQYPLLINVPVLFPQVGNFQFTFPIKPGDECLVVFSDLSIDNWWLNGNVQNPVEQRRHDLSDGIAIFGLMNQSRLKNQKKPASPSDGMAIVSTSTGEAVGIDPSGSAYAISEVPRPTFVDPDRVVMEKHTFTEMFLKLWPN